MKSRSLLLFGIVALLTVFGYQSCDLAKTGDPQIDVTQENPVYVLKGTITNAEDGSALAGISVFVNGEEVITDHQGMYELSNDIMPETGTIVTVNADGYVDAVGTIQYGEVVPNFYFMDFALSRELPANFVDLTEGGELTFEDVTVIIPANNSAVLNGQTVENVEISISPISPLSTMGNWVGATLKALKFEPAGIEFDIPVSFKVNTPDGYVHSGLSIYAYNSTENIWEEMENEVTYVNDQVNFSLKNFPGGIKLTLPSDIVLDADVLGVDPYNRTYEGNCDCSQPTVMGVGSYVRSLTIANNPDYAHNMGSMAELNSLHFFADNGLPYNAYIVNGILVNPAASVNVGQCDWLEVDVYPLYREIKGYYEYYGETKDFVVKYIYGATYQVTHVDCPTSSNCHQGCP